MLKAIYFHNNSDEDFTKTWDSIPYTVKSGDKVLLQDYIAVHLAKHLAMREMSKEDGQVVINSATDDNGVFTNKVFSDRVRSYLISDEDIAEDTQEKLDITMLQKKKGGRPKKVVEEEFPGLKK